MKVIETGLVDCKVVEMAKFGDERGFFMEAFNQKGLSESGIDLEIKQVNFASSSKNVLRGLHYQDKPHSQAKLVGVTRGAVLDVVVDLRKDSETYLKHVKVLLDRPDKLLYVPDGFAHGYKALQDDTLFYYFVDAFYAPDHEKGLLYNDPSIGIDWDLIEEPIVSPKDLLQPTLEHVRNNF